MDAVREPARANAPTQSADRPCLALTGEKLLVGHARTQHQVQIYDVRMMTLLQDIPWRKPKAEPVGGSGVKNKWAMVREAARASCSVVTAQFHDKDLLAGGTGLKNGNGGNEIKVFRPDADDVPQAFASFTVPSGVQGLHVSKKQIAGNAEVADATKLIAVAATNGLVYALRLPNPAKK